MKGLRPAYAAILCGLITALCTSTTFSNDSNRPLELSSGQPLQYSVSGNHQRLRALVSLKSKENNSIAMRFKVIADADSVQDYKDLYWRKGKPQLVYFGNLTILADKKIINIIRGPRGRGSIQYTINGAPKSLVIQTHYHEPQTNRLITKNITVTPKPKIPGDEAAKPKKKAAPAGVHLSTTFTEFKDDAFVDMNCDAGSSGEEYSKLNLYYRAPGLQPELVVGIHLSEPNANIRAKHFIHSEKGHKEKTEQARILQLECVTKHNIITSKMVEF